MRKSFTLPAACAASAMIVSGCAASGNTDQAEPSFDGMPNPFTEVSDLRGAAELAGFPIRGLLHNPVAPLILTSI